MTFSDNAGKGIFNSCCFGLRQLHSRYVFGISRLHQLLDCSRHLLKSSCCQDRLFNFIKRSIEAIIILPTVKKVKCTHSNLLVPNKITNKNATIVTVLFDSRVANVNSNILNPELNLKGKCNQNDPNSHTMGIQLYWQNKSQRSYSSPADWGHPYKYTIMMIHKRSKSSLQTSASSVYFLITAISQLTLSFQNADPVNKIVDSVEHKV